MERKINSISQSGFVPVTLILIGTLVLQCSLHARPPLAGVGEERKEKMQERMREISEQLGLTEEQKSTLQGYRESGREEMRAIREDDSLSKEEKREKMKELHESRKGSFAEILTEDQKAKLETMRSERAQR